MELSLKNFGIFKDNKFPLKQITIFFGQNESGKTTIFDSIVSALIKVTGTSVFGKKINARYEKNRTAKIFEDMASVLPGIFLNSYAIREGKMSVDDSDPSQKELIAVIQKSLFDSGFTSKQLRDLCLEKSETKGSVKSGKDLKKANEEFNAKRALLISADEERKNTIASWADLPAKESKKIELGNLLKETESEISDLSKKMIELTDREKYSISDGILLTILKWEEKQKTVENFEKWAKSGKDKLLPKLLDESKEISHQIKSLEAQFLSDKESAIILDKTLEECNIVLKVISKIEKDVAEIEKNLDRSLENTPPVAITIWNPLWTALGGGLILVGFLAFGLQLLQHQSFIWSLFGFVSISSGIGILFSKARSVQFSSDDRKLESEISKISEDLILRSNNTVVPILKTRDGIRDALKKYVQSKETASRNVESAHSSITSLSQKISKNSFEQSKINLTKNRCEGDIKSIFAEFSVTSPDEFIEKMGNAKIELNEFQNLNTHLSQLVLQYRLKDSSELKLKVRDDISKFEALAVTKQFTADDKNQINSIRIQLEKKQIESRDRKDSLHLVIEELSGLVGGSTVKMNDTLQKWESCLKSAEVAEITLRNVEANMSAYKFLSDVFTEMDTSSENQMQVLVSSLKKRWNHILPEETFRDIEWDDFSNTPRALDRQNSARDLEHLSSGTRELFYYALRLEYALRLSPDKNLNWILLDEPFRHMDNSRMASAVRYTLEFIKKEAWNAVFFSFDAELKDEIMKNAKEMNLNCILHELG